MAQTSDPALCFIGAGRVGSVLAYHFSKFNIPIRGIIETNDAGHPALRKIFPHIEIKSSLATEVIFESNIIFICVPDDHLAGVGDAIARLGIDLSEKSFVHTSGAYSSEILTPLKKRNGRIASAHPIYSFGSDDPASISLEKAYFDLEGDATAVAQLKNLFQKTGIKFIEITPAQKLAVHLASVFCSNYFVGLAQIAQEILRVSHFPKEYFWEPFVPLIESTLANLSSDSPANALTGPIKRGDTLTVEKHLTYLKSYYPDAVPAYVQMARTILQISSLPDEMIGRLEEILRTFDSMD